MKIISKRGRQPVKPQNNEQSFEHLDVIVIGDTTMTPEEIRRATEELKKLRDQLDEFEDFIDVG